MQESNRTHRHFSILGLIVLGLLVVGIITASDSLLRGLRLDLTENRLYTLSPGTRAVLSGVDEPIHLYFVFSKSSAQDLPTINTYGRRVLDMLHEMQALAPDRIKLSVIDPEPFSEQEDRAVQLGVQRIPLGSTGDNLYFGLAGTNAVGETEVIPYFARDREPLLEYDVAKLIYQLSQEEKPVVGLISGAPMSGGFQAGSMRMQPAWVVLEQLRQLFDVRNLEQDLASIPDEVGLLMVVHPTALTESARYAVDQFVLGGGHVLLFVDPYAEYMAATAMPGAQAEVSSNLPALLSAWGAEMTIQDVVGDSLYALRVTTDPSEAPIRDYTTFGVRPSSMNQDDIITGGLEGINVTLTGFLSPLERPDMQFTPLLSSSDQAMPIPTSRITPQLDPEALKQGFQSTGETYVLAARLQGLAATAFPDGPPNTTEADSGEHAQAPAPAESVHLSKASSPVNVVVFADTDLLADRLWVTVSSFFGQRIASPFASNGDLVINAVDNLLGSNDLISIRARASFSRPFDRVETLRLEAEQRLQAREQQLQTRLLETERNLNELQTGEKQADKLLLSEEQREAVKGFEQELVDTRKALRAVQHELNRNIEDLGTTLKFANIVLIPLILTLGLAIYAWRRRRGRHQA